MVQVRQYGRRFRQGIHGGNAQLDHLLTPIAGRRQCRGAPENSSPVGRGGSGMPQPMLLSIAGLLGLAVGSFLNVVIHRIPRDQSLVRPGSHCPHCGSLVRNRHNVPVLGWLLLRGRCADCAAPISIRYPLVEAGTAALFVAVAPKFGWSWELPAYLYLAAVSVA